MDIDHRTGTDVFHPVGAAPGHPAVNVKRLYLDFAGRLEQIVRGGVQAPDPVIEDACQVAWTRLIHHRSRVALETAEGWLTKTALHEAVKLTQRESREPSFEVEVEEAPEGSLQWERLDPEELLAQRERLELLGRLSRRQQRVLWLRALGLSSDEIASREGCTNRAVQRQLGRARHRLRVLEGESGASRAA